jgi:hypothetical protein
MIVAAEAETGLLSIPTCGHGGSTVEAGGLECREVRQKLILVGRIAA